jgi:hypothetical protein
MPKGDKLMKIKRRKTHLSRVTIFLVIAFLLAACASPTEAPTVTPSATVTSSPQPSPTGTATPTFTEEPTATVAPTTAPSPTEDAGLREDWPAYTNQIYGYRVFHPASAEVTETGVEGIPTEEMPEDVSFEEAAALLEEKLGTNLCVSIMYDLGYVNISAPTNQGYRYAICGPTGLGVGEVITWTETLTVGEQSYIVNVREFIAEDDNFHDDTAWLNLPDGTQIVYGKSDGDVDTYDRYLEWTRPILLQIVESYDGSVEGSFDWSTYEPPPTPAEEPVDGEDAFAFFADITVPDGTVFRPGETFEKIWRLVNTGDTTWTTDYVLVFESGDQMGAPETVGMPWDVFPGKPVNISVNMVAPDQEGEYTGFWLMRNDDEEAFGSGPDKDEPVWVNIIVVEEGDSLPTATPLADGSQVTEATLAVDQAEYSGGCPVTLNFSGQITSQGAVSFVYQFEVGSNTPGFEFFTPDAQTATFAGEGTHLHDVYLTLDILNSVDGWARITILAPNSLQSPQVNFSIECD